MWQFLSNIVDCHQSMYKECLLPFESTYRYHLRRIVCPYSLLSFMYKINWRRVNGQASARCFVKRCFAKSLLPMRRASTAQRPLLKSRPFQPPPARHPTRRPGPLLPTPSVSQRGPRPRVSICGQCTLLHEPRPFTEGPRNATALNNHPPEDRRPCARENAGNAGKQSWHTNSADCRAERWTARISCMQQGIINWIHR